MAQNQTSKKVSNKLYIKVEVLLWSGKWEGFHVTNCHLEIKKIHQTIVKMLQNENLQDIVTPFDVNVNQLKLLMK